MWIETEMMKKRGRRDQGYKDPGFFVKDVLCLFGPSLGHDESCTVLGAKDLSPTLRGC